MKDLFDHQKKQDAEIVGLRKELSGYQDKLTVLDNRVSEGFSAMAQQLEALLVLQQRDKEKIPLEESIG